MGIEYGRLYRAGWPVRGEIGDAVLYGRSPEYVTGRNYQRIDNGLGVTVQFDYGFRVDVEHVLTSSTDNLGDMTVVRLRYDF